MLDQPLTRRQAIALLMMFNFGSSVVMGVSTSVAQDSWISLLLATLYALPVVLMYGRIIALNPGKHLFDALESRMGRIFGKAVTLLMTWYTLHLSALVLRNFSEFLQISSLLETPQLPVAAIMLLTVSMLVRSGGKAMGKWAVATTPIVIGIVVLTVTFSIGIMKPENYLPILEHPISKIAKDAFQVFSFPFAEAVLFLAIADFVKPGDKPLRIYVLGMLLSALILQVIVARNLLVLGPAVVSVEYFPSYAAARIINLGDFLSRIEGSISVNFMLAGITKIAVCLIAASRGLASLFGIRSWRSMVMPAGLMALMLSTILYGSTMEMFGFVKSYPYYAIPFQIVLPMALWVVSEIRARKEKGCSGGQEKAGEPATQMPEGKDAPERA